MSEIYWLTRLDNLLVLFGVTSVISCAMVLVLGIMHMVDNQDEYLMKNDTRKKYIKIGAITGAIMGLILVFLPSKEEVLAIYGLGQAIDYIKENETIQKLPDKCVEALDAWVESLTMEE